MAAIYINILSTMLTYEYIIYIVITILLHIGVLFLLTRKKSNKTPLLGQHVVVTGGSQGIGLWAAVYCAQLGAHVTIIARNAEALRMSGRIQYIPAI